MKDIDFVIIWVDPNDSDWQKEKNQYDISSNNDDRPQRYRDWDNLQYIFRGIEKFTPWVRKVHFVTWGHIPKWMDTKNPKLNIVNHKDFIESKYLPVFNCNPIEMNLHRIEGLSEQFVYFNDDTFIIKAMEEKDFFYNNLPCDSAVLNVHCYTEKMFHFAPLRAVGVINKYFNMREVIKKDFFKWFNIKYGLKNIQTLILLGCPRFPGFWQHHLPSSFLKSTFEELWIKEPERLKETCTHKFRDILDFNQWLFKEWQLASGKFHPRRIKDTGKSFQIENGIHMAKTISKYILKQKGKMICINDGELTEKEFEESKKIVNEALNSILGEKSSFEK